jgi:hypothetical protein
MERTWLLRVAHNGVVVMRGALAAVPGTFDLLLHDVTAYESHPYGANDVSLDLAI